MGAGHQPGDAALLTRAPSGETADLECPHAGQAGFGGASLGKVACGFPVRTIAWALMGN